MSVEESVASTSFSQQIAGYAADYTATGLTQNSPRCTSGSCYTSAWTRTDALCRKNSDKALADPRHGELSSVRTNPPRRMNPHPSVNDCRTARRWRADVLYGSTDSKRLNQSLGWRLP